MDDKYNDRYSYLALVQYIGQLQKKHNCGSFELLSKTAPIQAASLAALGPFVDYALIGRNVFNYKFTLGAIVSDYCSLRLLCFGLPRNWSQCFAEVSQLFKYHISDWFAHVPRTQT